MSKRRWWPGSKNPAKPGIFATSRECLRDKSDVGVKGNGYAHWNGKRWSAQYSSTHRTTWGHHFWCDDFIWSGVGAHSASPYRSEPK